MSKMVCDITDEIDAFVKIYTETLLDSQKQRLKAGLEFLADECNEEEMREWLEEMVFSEEDIVENILEQMGSDFYLNDLRDMQHKMLDELMEQYEC